jgi:RNA polymerase sigma-70 factor (ECF subfamily)
MAMLFNMANAIPIEPENETQAAENVPARSFEAVYREYFAFVWRTAGALGVPQTNLDDAVQEVFVIVHRKLDSFEPMTALKSWLFGITRRVAKDYRRSLRRRGIRVSLTDAQLESHFLDPHVEARQKEALRIVEDYVDKLDEERRALFVLSEIEELPISEIAQLLKMNPNTLYSRLKIIKQDFVRFVGKRMKGEQGVFHE